MPMTFDWEKTNALAKALGGRVELLQELIKLRKADLSYSQIQDIVKSGFASEFFDLGDEIMTKYTATDGTEYDFPWRVVDFRDVYLEDGTVHPGMVLQGKYATAEQVAYDADDADWSHSSIRQWLNSDAEQGNWWTSTYDGDATPTELSTYNGFMHGLDEEFVNSLKATKLTTRITTTFGGDGTNTIDTYDKFYIASRVELYAVRGGSDTVFAYWKKMIGTYTSSFYPKECRIIKSIDDIATPCICPAREYAATLVNKVRGIAIDGSMGALYLVDNPMHVLPCCIIS